MRASGCDGTIVMAIASLDEPEEQTQEPEFDPGAFYGRFTTEEGDE